MFGYVRPQRSELTLREDAAYRGYYCGVCRALGKRCGGMCKMLLQYDAASLAVLLSALEQTAPKAETFRCALHPTVRKSRIACPAVDYAADVNMLLGAAKLDDACQDEGKLSARGMRPLVRRGARRAAQRQGELAARIDRAMAAQLALERRGCPDLDEACQPSADMMAAVFTGFEPAANQRDALNYIGQHIGRWVYLIDALDDLERDIKGGAYNVLTLRYGYEPGQPPAQFRRQAAEQVGVLLNLNLAYAAKGFDMLYLERNQPILENLFFLGLKTITQNIIDGRRQTDDRSLQGTGGI
ncbi:MAG: DUF5685 family protein [Christensenellales bacterium]|jgi:hypothetical protein